MCLNIEDEGSGTEFVSLLIYNVHCYNNSSSTPLS